MISLLFINERYPYCSMQESMCIGCGITKRWVDTGLQNRMMSISSIAVLKKVVAARHCVVHVDHEVHRNTFALTTHLHDILG